jgi:hypothetical protein
LAEANGNEFWIDVGRETMRGSYLPLFTINRWLKPTAMNIELSRP